VETASQKHTKPYLTTYDPVLAEWKRFKTPLTGSCPAWTPEGMVDVSFRPGASYLRLDYKSMTLKKVATKGEFARKSAADWFGMTYDSKRNRLVAVNRGKNYTGGSLKVVSLADNRVSTLKPENPKALGAGCTYIREFRYIPDADVYLICDGIGGSSRMPAYDPKENRWLILKMKNQPIGRRNKPMWGWSFGCRYDRKRRILWAIDTYGNVCALRLDLKAALK
jgi:hypothetical protein